MPVSRIFLEDSEYKIQEFSDKYSSYRGVDRLSIISWLKRFDSDEDAIVGLKLLENIDYYNTPRIHSLLKELKETLDLHFKENIYFCAFGKPGKSGDFMLSEFRMANSLGRNKYDRLFIRMDDIIKLESEACNVVVVLLDDVCGSGEQAKDFLPKVLEITPPNVKLVFCPLIIPLDTKKLLESEFDIDILCPSILEAKSNIFSRDNKTFTKKEKDILSKYCKRTGSGAAGFGDMGMTVVVQRNTPNNSIPILRSNNKSWTGLFKRSC